MGQGAPQSRLGRGTTLTRLCQALRGAQLSPHCAPVRGRAPTEPSGAGQGLVNRGAGPEPQVGLFQTGRAHGLLLPSSTAPADELGVVGVAAVSGGVGGQRRQQIGTLSRCYDNSPGLTDRPGC